ncbi:hypothetical protein [Segetibacter koreensis]|uniref:hypothetical protein n=1 Tax=Segetibacter koreensis TaxID=398037 RepID=UPI0003706CCA|nr:hypothetical protein [Segetibacter koreensis]
MYVVNDIELLERLHKHKILVHLIQCCSITVSGLRLHHYSSRVRQIIEASDHVEIVHFEMNDFDDWAKGKKKILSLTDLSSLYVALSKQGAILASSEEDHFLVEEAKKCFVTSVPFDQLFLTLIKDQRIIQLYNLIKAA